jgi:asparagine synthetase B (glutamine-hydrolysing)
MPGIVGLFSRSQQIDTRSSRKIFNKMADRLSHRGPLSEFSQKLPTGIVRLGLFSERPINFKNKFGDRFVRHILVDECQEINVIPYAPVFRILDPRNRQSDIYGTQMINAIGVTEDNRILVFRSLDGARPLYYAELSYGLALSSEKKGIWQITKEEPKVFEPGSMLIVSEDGTWKFEKVQSYTRSKRVIDPAALLPLLGVELDEFEETLTENKDKIDFVLNQLSWILKSLIYPQPQERPIGVLFSGGVDSSLIADLVRRKIGKNTRLISVAAADSRDSRTARRAASRLSLDHMIVDFNEDIVWNILPEVIYAIESTKRMDVEIAIPFFLAAKRTKEEGIRYLVSGQGPDELFAGYARYERFLVEDGAERVAAELWADFSMSHEANIVRDEKVMAYHGINTSFPYLNVNFCNLAFALPIELILDPSKKPSRKIIFREAAQWFGIPEEIANAQKRATQFSSGSAKMLRKSVSKYVEDAKDSSKKEMSILTLKVIHTIASEIGIPGSHRPKQKLVMDMGPTQRLIERVGRLPTRNLG